MPSDLIFDLGPTQAEFVTSDAHIAQVISPMGEGKTFSGIAGMIYHAQRNRQALRSALIRDTFQNIKTSTIPDIRDCLKEWVRFSDGGRAMTIMSEPRVHCDLFGIDSEADISKLQGPQYGLIWLEEPAPIYEKANAGLPIGVYRMALARVARQSGTIPRLQITQNPADEEHWTAELADEPHEYTQIFDENTGQWVTVYKETFRIPRGENKFLSPIARAMNEAAFKGDPGKYQRYVLGEEAMVSQGKRVTQAYDHRVHFSPKILPVLKGEAIQMWDSWLDATCIIAQYNPLGQLVIHDVLLEEGLGPEELIEEKVLPLLNMPKYKDKVKVQSPWRIIGDQSMRNPDQSSARRSAARLIEGVFKARFEPGPAHWHAMRNVPNQCCRARTPQGHPLILLSRSATKLHRALKGGWHYKTDPSGRIMGDKPDKNIHSHPGDAFANGLAILHPQRNEEQRPGVNPKVAGKLARSYGGGNYSRRVAAAGGAIVNPF